MKMASLDTVVSPRQLTCNPKVSGKAAGQWDGANCTFNQIAGFILINP
jgi:hypothetical protein